MMTDWLRRLWYLLNRARHERDLEREMAAHRAQMPDARRFGSTLRLREEAREAWGWTWLDDLRQDVRHGVRTLARSPGFTLTAVLTLALGIGATTATLSLVRAVLLDPLPYPDASRLVTVWVDGSRTGLTAEIEAPPAIFFDWQSQNTVFARMAALDFGDVSLTGTGDPIRLHGYRVTHDLFTVLDVPPMLGRAFREEEEEPAHAAVAILGHALWQSRFGGSSAVVGQEIRLDDQLHTVIGVMPPGFDFPARGTEIWRPYATTPEQRSNRGAYNLRVIARLQEGVALARARDEMDALTRRLTENAPERFRTGATVTPLHDRLVRETRTAVLLLFALAGSVLLIAAANLANLVLARAVTHHRETTLRMALGAGRGRVFRQLVTEHLVLVGAGTGLGLLVATVTFDSLSRLVPQNLTSARLAIDVGLLLCAVMLCALITLVLGALLCRLASQSHVSDALRQADARTGESRATHRLRASLVVAQTAFAVALLIAAGLMVQTYARLMQVDPGFQGDRVLTVRTELPVPRYADAVRRAAFYTGVLERVHALPGVTSAGFTTFLPFVFSGVATVVAIEGRLEPPINPAGVRLITPGYIPAMGMRLVRGRLPDESDRQDTEPVVAINETMARLFWPAEDAIGRRFRPNGCEDCPWLAVVGIVGDVHQEALRANVRPEYYQPFVQVPRSATLPPFIAPKDLAIRTAGDPRLLIESVRQAIWEVDPDQPIAAVRVMADYVDEDLAPDRLQAQLIGVFAGLALLLASLGVYGVLAYAVAQRRREIGLRMALGAEQRDLVRWTVGRGLRPVAAGLVIGLLAAYGLTHLVASLLYGVRPRDPLTFSLAAATLFAVALLACWWPARRAARVDPFEVLRSE